MANDDRITLRATSTFWYAPESRHLHRGDEFTISRADFPLYGEVARELVSGDLFPSPKPNFVEQVKHKVVAVAQTVVEAVATEEVSKWTCEHCGQGFKAEKGLAIHLKNAHKDVLE